MDSCECYAHTKSPKPDPLAPVVSLENLASPWTAISLDFIIELPPFYGHTVVLTVVECLTKMTHFIPCKQLASAETTAQLLLHNVVQFHGIPDHIVFDRGPQFTSHFHCEAFRLLDI